MKKFILLSILFSAFFGDCFSMDLKRKDRNDSDDEDTSRNHPPRRSKITRELKPRELHMLANMPALDQELLACIQLTLAEYAQAGILIDNIIDREGRTLLSKVSNVDFASMLVRYGAQVNMAQFSPLFYALTEAREHVAYFLITQCGASIENLATHSPVDPSILVLAGGCSQEFRLFLTQYRQHLAQLQAPGEEGQMVD